MSVSRPQVPPCRPSGREGAARRKTLVLLVLPRTRPVSLPGNRRGRAGGLAVSVLLHLGIAALTYFIVVGTSPPPLPAEGAEGAPGDDGHTFTWVQPRPSPRPPVVPPPALVPEKAPTLLASSAPSPVALPREETTAPPEVEPPAVPDASPVAGSPAEKEGRPGRPGRNGTGKKGRGRLSAGEGTGTVTPSSPRLLSQTAPEYPPAARARRAQGTAWVRVEVSAAGSVAAASLHRSCGHDDLDAAAVRTARRWRFLPATAGGRPVPAAAVVKVAFVLGR